MSQFPKPPKWADRFLQWFVDEDLIEEIQGDLHEAYYYRIQTEGLETARKLFIADVFRFFRPYAFEKYSNTKQFLPMFNNYFKIAIRNIFHRKQFTAINLLGLSIGISAVLLIGLYLQKEWTYDQSIPEHENIYRLVNSYRDQVYACMAFGNYNNSNQKEQLKLVNHLQNYEAVKTAGHFVPSGSAISDGEKYYIRLNDKEYVQEKILFTNTGQAFLDLFPQSFLLGNKAASFLDFNQALLSQAMAIKYFGSNWQQQEILGKSFTFQEQDYEIIGVVEDLPSNVHYYFEIILHQPQINSWGAYTYLKTAKNNTIEPLIAQLNQDVDKIFPGYTEDELSKGISAIPLTDIHFTKGLLYELKPIANNTYLRTFGIIALIILLIIWTNYTNLSIAMYADRQKELGMRKVMGARSKDISFQLLIEAVLLTLLCLPFAWLILQWIMPKLNQSMGWELDINLLYSATTLLILFGILFFTGIFSGLYPALVYGQKSMIKLFTANLSGQPGQGLFNFRNSLVAVQFTLLVGLLSLTFYIHQQMDFIAQKDLGFNKEGVLFFELNGEEKYKLLKAKLSEIPEIQSIGSGLIPGQQMFNQLTYKIKNSETTLNDGTFIYADADAFKVLGMECEACQKVEAGKDFTFVINRTGAEKLAKIIGKQPEDLIGETLISEPEYENERYGFGIPYTIAGIIDDYDYFSLKYPAQTIMLRVVKEPNYTYNMIVKAQSTNWSNTTAAIEKAYKSVETAQPFSFKFLDEHLQSLYLSEKRAGIFISGISLVAVLLALIGLAGIVAYIAFNRQKEIGIRKVFGASIKDILWIMNKEFVLLMGLAILLATPITIYLTSQWLDSFAYRITINPIIILIAGLAALILVFLVVSLQTRRTIGRNPIDALNHR